MIIKKPLSEDDKKILADKEKPSAQMIQAAQDALFMSILTRLNDLERDKNNV